MAILNTRTNRPQKRLSQVFKSPHNLMTYGAPLFDEAKLQALFSQIGNLETQATTETSSIVRTNVETNLLTKITAQQKSVVKEADTYRNTFSEAANATARNGLAYMTGKHIMELGAGNREYGADGYRDADVMDAGYTAFLSLLSAAGFTAATITAATGAVSVLRKYALFRYQSYTTGSQGATYVGVSPDANPATSKVAREITGILFAMLGAISNADLYEAKYPATPNPFAADYSTQFTSYFNATFIA